MLQVWEGSPHRSRRTEHGTPLALLPLGKEVKAMRKSGVNATALFGLLAMSSSNAFADDQDVRLDQVPARVRQAIEKEVKDGQITEIQREMGARNRVVYEVEYTAADGTRYELDVAEDGTILKRERD